MKTNLTFATPDRADELDVFRAIYADLLRTPSCLTKEDLSSVVSK
jgi:hypothetical protein